MALQIVARTGDGEQYLLVADSVEAGASPPENTPARVLDVRAGVLHEPRAFRSITAHIPRFEEYEPEDGELDELLSGVSVRGPPKDSVGVVEA